VDQLAAQPAPEPRFDLSIGTVGRSGNFKSALVCMARPPIKAVAAAAHGDHPHQLRTAPDRSFTLRWKSVTLTLALTGLQRLAGLRGSPVVWNMAAARTPKTNIQIGRKA
jgi:hypothetical protein